MYLQWPLPPRLNSRFNLSAAFLIKAFRVNYYEWSTYESLYTTQWLHFWALKILNIKLLTFNFSSLWIEGSKYFNFLIRGGKKNLPSQAEAFHSSSTQEKRFHVCYKPLKIRAHPRNIERPLITEVLAGATVIHNHYFIAYTEELIHAHFLPLKILFGNHYYSCRHIL